PPGAETATAAARCERAAGDHAPGCGPRCARRIGRGSERCPACTIAPAPKMADTGRKSPSSGPKTVRDGEDATTRVARATREGDGGVKFLEPHRTQYPALAIVRWPHIRPKCGGPTA